MWLIAGAPAGAVMSATGMPWWAWLICVLSCTVLYICRLVVVYRLGSKALDKAQPHQVARVLEAVTGHRRPPQDEAARSD
jgi:hypothetical protein